MVTASFSIVGSDHRKLTILGGVLAVLFGLFYTHWIRPLSKEVGRLDKEIARLETDIKLAVTVRNELERFTRLLEKRRAHLNRLKVLFPTRGDSTQIIHRIQDLAVDSRLRIKSLTPQQKTSCDFYDTQYITVVVHGTYHHLGLFFQEISEANWILNVESLELKAVDDCVGGCSLRASCLLALFFVPEDGTLPGKQMKP